MRHPEFPIVAFLVVPLLLVSLPSHIRARSIATIAIAAWMIVLNIIFGINSLIWADNTTIRLEVWCDIATKIEIGFTFAIPLAALCICRHLENVASNRHAIITQDDKQRRMRFEAIMCFGVPIIFMALHYVVQGHRFDIVENVGCSPYTYVSIPAVLLVWVPPFAFSLTSMVYAILAFHHFLKRRIEFSAVLKRSNSSLSASRYFRLMALAVFEIFWDTGINIYLLWFNIASGLRPWISWEDVHADFSHVTRIPFFLISDSEISQIIWRWWIVPISSIAFFIFFGFGEEAMADYRAAYRWFKRVVLRIKVGSDTESDVLPSYRVHSQQTRVMIPDFPEKSLTRDSSPWNELTLNILDMGDHSTMSSSRRDSKPTIISSARHSEYETPDGSPTTQEVPPKPI